MKKRERRTFGQVLSGIFNFRMWMGAEGIRSFWHFITDSFRKMFIPAPHKIEKTNQETFSDAQNRLGLTDETLLTRQKALLRFSMLLFLAGFLLLVYAVFQFFYGKFPGFLLTLSLTGLAFAMAFRYHFWFFQIKERKLGCSLREWYHYGLRGEKR